MCIFNFVKTHNWRLSLCTVALFVRCARFARWLPARRPCACSDGEWQALFLTMKKLFVSKYDYQRTVKKLVLRRSPSSWDFTARATTSKSARNRNCVDNGAYKLLGDFRSNRDIGNSVTEYNNEQRHRLTRAYHNFYIFDRKSSFNTYTYIKLSINFSDFSKRTLKNFTRH